MTTRNLTRRDFVRLATLASGGAMLSACTPAASTVAPTLAPTVSSSAAPTVAPIVLPSPTAGAPQPQYGGILATQMKSDPPNFDTITNTTSRVLFVCAPCYNSLVMYDPLDPQKIIGDLAQEWQISSDGKMYSFQLVKGAKFHDGKLLTAADVKYTFDFIRNPPDGIVCPRQNALAAVDSIETEGDYTVHFMLNRPSPSLLINLATGYMLVLPKHILEVKHNMNDVVVGSGPFMLKEFKQGVSVELVRNPDYHVQGRPYLDGITVYIIPDRNTTFQYFRTGQVLYFDGMQGDEAKTAEEEFGDKVAIDSCPGLGWYAIMFNSKRKPWDDVRVRQAVSLAIDREECLRVTRQGEGYVGGLMVPGMWALPWDEVQKYPGYGSDIEANRAAAKQLLAEAGFPNGFSTVLMNKQGDQEEILGVYVKDQLAKIGIDATLEMQDDATSLANLNDRNFEISPWSGTYAANDPDTVFGETYVCDAPRNYSSICIPKLDELYEQQSGTTDVEARRLLVNDMEREALQAVSRAMLTWKKPFIGFSRRVHGLIRHPEQDNARRFQDVWLSEA